IVVGTRADGETYDATSVAKVTLSRTGVAVLDGNMLRPVKDGEVAITAVHSDQRATANLVVRGCAHQRPVSFRNDVLPVLMKAGCNAGSCHGSAQGKNGFRLSLFGFEPEKDYISLTRDWDARRIDLADPHRSLMLRKPSAEVSHEGGQRLVPKG